VKLPVLMIVLLATAAFGLTGLLRVIAAAWEHPTLASARCSRLVSRDLWLCPCLDPQLQIHSFDRPRVGASSAQQPVCKGEIS